MLAAAFATRARPVTAGGRSTPEERTTRGSMHGWTPTHPSCGTQDSTRARRIPDGRMRGGWTLGMFLRSMGAPSTHTCPRPTWGLPMQVHVWARPRRGASIDAPTSRPIRSTAVPARSSARPCRSAPAAYAGALHRRSRAGRRAWTREPTPRTAAGAACDARPPRRAREVHAPVRAGASRAADAASIR